MRRKNPALPPPCVRTGPGAFGAGPLRREEGKPCPPWGGPSHGFRVTDRGRWTPPGETVTLVHIKSGATVYFIASDHPQPGPSTSHLPHPPPWMTGASPTS